MPYRIWFIMGARVRMSAIGLDKIKPGDPRAISREVWQARRGTVAHPCKISTGVNVIWDGEPRPSVHYHADIEEDK